MPRSVLLGSRMELHTGIHESLQRSPPNDVKYVRRAARHIFLLPSQTSRREFQPLRDIHWGELVDFGPGPELVHSARWPVLHRARWIADLDDFAYPVVAGRVASSIGFQRRFRRPWSRGLERSIRRRAAFMLTAFAHESCHAVLFRSRAGLRAAASWLRALSVHALAETYLSKCHVVLPAERALETHRAQKKWNAEGPLRALFVGRDFEAKGGEVALQALQLARAAGADVELTFVGPIPAVIVRRFAGVAKHLHHLATIPHDEVLRIMSVNHVLLHAAEQESIGMVFVEGAANAMAVVAMDSPGLTALRELLPQEGVERVTTPNGTLEDQALGYAQLLVSWSKDRTLPRLRAFANLRAAQTGPISIQQRNQAITTIYERARERRTAALQLADLTLDVTPVVARWTSERLAALELRAVAARGGRTITHF